MQGHSIGPKELHWQKTCGAPNKIWWRPQTSYPTPIYESEAEILGTQKKKKKDDQTDTFYPFIRAGHILLHFDDLIISHLKCFMLIAKHQSSILPDALMFSRSYSLRISWKNATQMRERVQIYWDAMNRQNNNSLSMMRSFLMKICINKNSECSVDSFKAGRENFETVLQNLLWPWKGFKAIKTIMTVKSSTDILIV